MNAISSFESELEYLRAVGNLRSLHPLEHDGPYVLQHGRRMLNLSSNDYLGLASDEGLRAAFLDRLTPENFLMSASSSRLLAGDFPICGQVEELLAGMYGKEAALVFNSGYHMNVGILPALAGNNTLIVADKLVHASLIDGIRLSKAAFCRFRHGNMEQLDMILERSHAKYRQIIVAVESVYSMDGDKACLPQICDMKRHYGNVFIYVDEAHAFGVLGENGLGLAEEQGCIHDLDYICGTFGKALASVGGFIVCSRVAREYLVNRMRPFIYSTALPPLNWMWTLFLLRQLKDMKMRRRHLANLSAVLREALRDAGTMPLSSTHIVPLLAGESNQAARWAEQLQSRGFYVLPVRPPTVPEGTARLRFSLAASMKGKEIDNLVQNILEVKDGI